MFEHVAYLLSNDKLSFSFHFGQLRLFWKEPYICGPVGVGVHDDSTHAKKKKKKIFIGVGSDVKQKSAKINYRRMKITITALCGLSDAIIAINTTTAYFWAQK